MKLVLLDGTFGDETLLARDRVESDFKSQGYEVQVFKIESLNIAYCTGCWSCWFRTPGKCIHQDDTHNLLRAVINADMVVHFTENSLGFATSLSKKVLDKFVPLVHPYITLDRGECHHVKRYDSYPTFGFAFVDDEMDREDFKRTWTIFKRAALNFKSDMTYAIHLTKSGKEVIYESDLV